MGLVKRQTFKGTVYSFIGVGLGFVTTGLLFPKLFTTEQNGLLKLLISYSVIFSQICTLGFNNVTTKFFPYFRNNDNGHNGFTVLLIIVQAIGYLFFIGLFFLSKDLIIDINQEKSHLFTLYVDYIIPVVFFMMFFGLLDHYSKMILKATRGIFISELLQRVLIFIAVLIFYIEVIDFDGFIISYLIAFSLPSLVLFGWLFLDKAFSLKPNFQLINKKMLYKMISVSLFSLLIGLSNVLIKNVDSIMIGSMVSLNATGVYAINCFFGILVSLPARTIQKVISSFYAESWKSNDRDQIKELYEKTSLNQFIIGLLLLLIIWVNSTHIYQILPVEYESGKYVILFIGMTNLLEMLAGGNSVIIGTSNYYKFNTLFIGLLFVLIVLTNLVFIPSYGITGAALASAISFFVYHFIKWLFLYKLFKFNPIGIKNLIILGIGVASYILVYYMPSVSIQLPYYIPVIITILIKSITIVCLYLIPIVILRISPIINAKLEEFWCLIRK